MLRRDSSLELLQQSTNKREKKKNRLTRITDASSIPYATKVPSTLKVYVDGPSLALNLEPEPVCVCVRVPCVAILMDHRSNPITTVKT